MDLVHAPSVQLPENAPHKHAGVGRLVLSVAEIETWLARNLTTLDHPEVYASHGDEMNTVSRDWDAAPLRVCLVSGMAYRNSVGNLALPLMYSELAERAPSNWYIDRAYFWETRKNFEKMTKAGIPPIALQSHRPLRDFDILAFSCSYLQTELHVGLFLKWSGIPVHAVDRGEVDPLVLIGGHHMYVNPEPIWQIPDVIFVGEFSAGAAVMMDSYRAAKAQGQARWDWIYDYARMKDGRVVHPGFYVPSFYSEEYSNTAPYPIKSKTPTRPDIPPRVPKAYSHNLDLEAHINRRPIVSYMNPSMGTAEIQSSYGCDTATCTFCSEGQTNKPYRFFSVPTLVEAAKEQMRTSGMRSFTLSAFDGAGHPLKRHLLRRLLEEVSDDVSLLSLRVDEMAKDDIFSMVSTAAGNKTLSLGVEGMSERMRTVFQKWCTVKDIMTVVERAIASGATKVKFFMIANHPWETEEDRMEWVTVLEEIEAIKMRYASKCQILTSWTPLVIMPHTALQWEAPTPDHRTLHGIINAIKERTKTDFRIGSGGRRDEAYFAQLLQIGDRRLSTVIDWCIDHDFLHYGSTSRGMIKTLEGLLAAIPDFPEPLGWHTWFRTKPYEEPLAWDILDVGPSKEWLIMVNEISKLGQQQVGTCASGCSACGACTDLDRIKMASGHAMRDDDFDLHEINVIRQRGSVQVLRLKLIIDEAHRFIDNEYWEAGLIRAFRMADLPVDKSKVAMVTSRYDFFDYTYGVDYADVGMLSRVRASDVIEVVTPFLPRGMSIVDVRAYSASVGMLRNAAGAAHYIVDVRSLYSTHATKLALERMLGSTEFIASMKQKAFRKGIVSVDVDVRPWVLDAWVEPSGFLHLLLKGKVNPYELLPALYETARRKILGFGVIRAEIFLDDKDAHQIDAFRPVCPKTGVKLLPNMFDEVHASGLYTRALFNRVALDIQPVGRIIVRNLDEQELAEDSEMVRHEDMFDEMMEEEFALVRRGVVLP